MRVLQSACRAKACPSQLEATHSSSLAAGLENKTSERGKRHGEYSNTCLIVFDSSNKPWKSALEAGSQPWKSAHDHPPLDFKHKGLMELDFKVEGCLFRFNDVDRKELQNVGHEGRHLHQRDKPTPASDEHIQ